jgi:hypothetical protein
MPRERIIFPRTRAKSQRFMISLGVALRAARKDYERDHKTAGSDSYRLLDIATRAIQLLFPGTDEDDIDLPASEYPHVPSARSIVRDRIEMMVAVTPVSVSPRASSGPQVLFFGECGGSWRHPEGTRQGAGSHLERAALSKHVG